MTVLHSGWIAFSGCMTSLARALAVPPWVTSRRASSNTRTTSVCSTAAEGSERVSALASGSRASASMEMSAPKSKGMHVNISVDGSGGGHAPSHSHRG